MNKSALALVVATWFVASSAAMAVPLYYGITDGLASTITGTTPTTWAGQAAVQPKGTLGWTFLAGADPGIYPWTGPYGATYAGPTNLSSLAYMTRRNAAGGTDFGCGWNNGVSGYDENAGAIVQSDALCEKTVGGVGVSLGTTVAFRHGWNSSHFALLAAVWTAPAAGTANVAYTLYSAANNSGAEFQLALYQAGVFAQELAWGDVIGSTNTGVGNGVTITATGITLGAGDSIVLLSRSDNYNLYGTRQDNAAAAGGITFDTVPEPATLSLLALGALTLSRRRR